MRRYLRRIRRRRGLGPGPVVRGYYGLGADAHKGDVVAGRSRTSRSADALLDLAILGSVGIGAVALAYARDALGLTGVFVGLACALVALAGPRHGREVAAAAGFLILVIVVGCFVGIFGALVSVRREAPVGLILTVIFAWLALLELRRYYLAVEADERAKR